MAASFDVMPGELRRVSGRVLYVDDEEMLVKLGVESLTAIGCRVDAFSDSREALAAFVADPGRYDALVTDQTMPELSGLQLAEEILALRPDFPVLLLTGFSETVDEEKARAVGVREFLMKPVILSDFSRVMSRILPPAP